MFRTTLAYDIQIEVFYDKCLNTIVSPIECFIKENIISTQLEVPAGSELIERTTTMWPEATQHSAPS